MRKITAILGALFLCAFMLAGPAAAMPLNNVQILSSGTSYNNWDTVYKFKADELGTGYNSVFCVENAYVNAQFEYELIDYAGRGLETAAKMADAFYSGGIAGLNAGQRDFQIAIWHQLGIVSGKATGAAGRILSYDWANYTLQGDIALLNSPPGSATGSAQSQDFLINRKVAVPEPTMALMLGGLLTGIGVLGRRQFLKK